MDASEIYSKRLNAKEVIFLKEKGEFNFPIADGRIKLLGGDQDLRIFTLVRHRPIRCESHLDFLVESEGSFPPPHDSFPDAGEAINDFWSMSGNFKNRHHVEPRVKLYSPREDKKAAYIQARSLWPELWTKLGRNAQLKERQKWSHEKPKLDNARKLRKNFFIDPEDKEFKESINNARKKLETSVAPAMPCKISKNNQNCGNGEKSNEIKSKFACFLEASESTRLRIGESLPNHHEDHFAGTGENSLQHYNLVHKFIPMPQVVKIPAAKAAVDKEWEKLEKISAWNLTKVRSKKKVIDEVRRKCAKVHFASLMDICHLKNAELETKHQKYKGRVVLRGDIVKDDSGSYAVFTEQGFFSISNDSS